MPELPPHSLPWSPMISLHALRERKLVHWALAYLAGAWALLQVADLIGERFAWPDAWLRVLIVVLAVGFVATLVLAWYHGEKGRPSVSGVELAMLAALLVIAGAGIAWVRAARSPAGAREPAGASGVSGLPLPAEQGSIAVLPFADLSPQGDQEYFSDGIAEELLNVLAQLPELRVASRTSAFSFKDGDASIDSIARALNVRHVLEGSVRTAGDQVRITAQLIDASTGYHLWSETYTRKLVDIFAIQDEISRRIVDELELRLAGGNRTLARAETDDPEAHTLVLKATQIARIRSAEKLAQAAALLEDAVARDPQYARAYAQLARTREMQVYYAYADRATLPRARAAAERALAIDSTDADAHFVLGVIASDYDWKWQEASAHYAQAIAHHPGYSPAYQARAWLQMRLGRTDQALALAARALELDPISVGAYNTAAAMQLYAGNAAASIALAEEALRLQPGDPVLLGNIAFSYVAAGRHEEAIRRARQANDVAPGNQFILATLGYALAKAGHTAEAGRVLDSLRALPDASPYLQASVYAGLGDRARVLDLVEHALDARDTAVPDLGVDPVMLDYRDEPRVRRVLQRMGLPS